MRLNQKQCEVLAEKLADLGNVAVGSLVFGYVLKSDAFNYLSLLLGIVISVVGYTLAVTLTRQ